MLPTLFTLLKEYCALSLAGAAGSIIFVATKILCHEKHNFVATKHLSQQAYFCHDKRPVLSQQTRVCRDKTFVATKMVLVAILKGRRFDSASALLSLQKGCDLWTLSCDFVPHNSCKIKMALISAYLNARIILVVTVVVLLNVLRCQLTY